LHAARSTYAHLARFVADSQPPNSAREIIAHHNYGRATAQARASTGEDDYYPLLNMLDGAFLLEARGAEGPFAAIAKSITAQCAAARRNADRRMRDEPDFFHAVVEAGTALTSALYATLKKPVKDARGIDDAAAQREIVAHYSVQIRRFGTAREWDSVVSHVESLLEMLPERQPANSRVDVKAARAGLAVLLKQLRAAQSS
jgi:nucleoside 2-deoxyribosyltransferase